MGSQIVTRELASYATALTSQIEYLQAPTDCPARVMTGMLPGLGRDDTSFRR